MKSPKQQAMQSAIAAALQSKQAELDKAIEALRPVADWWNAYKATCDYYGSGIAKNTQPIVGNFPLLTYGHCRQAAALVARHDKAKARHDGAKHRQLDKSGLAK